MHTASLTATEYPVCRLAKKGEKIRIRRTENGFVFETCNKHNPAEVVEVPDKACLFLNDEIPQEIRLDYEIGYNLHQAVLIAGTGIRFRYENDRDNPIPLSVLAVPPITFTVMDIG